MRTALVGFWVWWSWAEDSEAGGQGGGDRDAMGCLAEVVADEDFEVPWKESTTLKAHRAVDSII